MYNLSLSVYIPIFTSPWTAHDDGALTPTRLSYDQSEVEI